MTIHAAKGLEFKAVFVTGLEENLFPSQLSLNVREELEEERRLFYVALTRAEEFLTLTYATSRYKWGQIDYCEPSRFLQEIDQSLLDMPTENNGGSGFFSFENERSSFGSFSPRKISGEGFNPMRKTHIPTASPKPQGSFKPLAKKPIADSAGSSNEFIPDNPQKLKVGMRVEHERFGMGKVMVIDTQSGDKKAIVLFEKAGQKQLLLKFARLKIFES
jgi:DNA helicase-2/ATP-dependent DNA helicase PcrA